jgi:hypothetical protein
MGESGDVREAWEYAETGGVHRWHWPQVVALTLAAALLWSILMYLLSLVVGRVV